MLYCANFSVIQTVSSSTCEPPKSLRYFVTPNAPKLLTDRGTGVSLSHVPAVSATACQLVPNTTQIIIHSAQWTGTLHPDTEAACPVQVSAEHFGASHPPCNSPVRKPSCSTESQLALTWSLPIWLSTDHIQSDPAGAHSPSQHYINRITHRKAVLAGARKQCSRQGGFPEDVKWLQQYPGNTSNYGCGQRRGNGMCAWDTALATFKNSTFWPHSVFMCSVWISEQTAIISLYSINWLVFITETECLLRGANWMFN
jgi:hypothetical protein